MKLRSGRISSGCSGLEDFNNTEIIIVLRVMLAGVLSLSLGLVQMVLRIEELSKDQELSSLESGFESLYSALDVRSPFFFLAVLFVLFDVELIILFPGVFFHPILFPGTTNIWARVVIVVLGTLLLE